MSVLRDQAQRERLSKERQVEYRFPIEKGWITTAQGERSFPVRGYHPGIDLADSENNPNVVCVADGTVCCVYRDSESETVYGTRVFVDHPDGKQSRYNHLAVVEVREGQKIKRGDVVGKMGNTGRNNTGQHLDFEILSVQTDNRVSPDIGYTHFLDPLLVLGVPKWLKLGDGVEDYEGTIMNRTEAKMRGSGRYNKEENRFGPYRSI